MSLNKFYDSTKQTYGLECYFKKLRCVDLEVDNEPWGGGATLQLISGTTYNSLDVSTYQTAMLKGLGQGIGPSATITDILPKDDNDVLTLYCIPDVIGANTATLTIKHNTTTGGDGVVILCPNSVDLVLTATGATPLLKATLIYIAADNTWHCRSG